MAITLQEAQILFDRGSLAALDSMEHAVREACSEMRKKSITLAEFHALIEQCRLGIKGIHLDTANAKESAEESPAGSQ